MLIIPLFFRCFINRELKELLLNSSMRWEIPKLMKTQWLEGISPSYHALKWGNMMHIPKLMRMTAIGSSIGITMLPNIRFDRHWWRWLLWLLPGCQVQEEYMKYLQEDPCTKISEDEILLGELEFFDIQRKGAYSWKLPCAITQNFG